MTKFKLPLIKTKAGQYTWLQLLTLAISIVAYMLGYMPLAIVMLLAGTFFGIIATYARVQEAKYIRQQQATRAPRNRSRR